jgi:hypothetical protein
MKAKRERMPSIIRRLSWPGIIQVAAVFAVLTVIAQEQALVSFTTGLIRVQEYEAEAMVHVRRTGNLDVRMTVDYATEPLSGATPGADYEDISGTLVFEPLQELGTVLVPIINDGEPESTESVRVNLSNPSEGAELGARTTCTIYIMDNDRQADVGVLPVTVGGEVNRDWSGQGLSWGQGYPAVNVSFDTDESIRFSAAQGGGLKQLITELEIARGSQMNDQPEFTTAYTNNLKVNGLIADIGSVTLTYNLGFATRLLDLLVLDVDDEDVVHIECRDLHGDFLNPGLLEIVMEGDLSRYANAPGRPAAEPATPPLWDAATGTLTSAVIWNENRSYTVLRPTVAVSQVQVTFTGRRGAAAPGQWGSHIYTALWATPRPLELIALSHDQHAGYRLRWNSLPDVPYHILSSSDLQTWADAKAVLGAASPAVTTDTVLAGGPAEPVRFFKIQRW